MLIVNDLQQRQVEVVGSLTPEFQTFDFLKSLPVQFLRICCLLFAFEQRARDVV
jgi:hypothetical protein